MRTSAIHDREIRSQHMACLVTASYAGAMYAPKPHQATAIAAVLGYFTNDNATRASIIMACGTGKTLVACWSFQGLDVPTVVFLSPSIQVSAQAAASWAKHGTSATVIVCSDDDPLGDDRPPELDGVPVTTSTDEITAILGSRIAWAIFGTYASADKIGAALRALGATADLLVCDEAHHLAGRDGKQYSLVLCDDGIAARRRLFFTATPKVNTRNDPGSVGMDDRDIFGEEVYRLGFAEAIKECLIADYRILCVQVPDGTDLDDPNATDKALHVAIAREVRNGLTCPILFRSSRKLCERSAAIFNGLDIPAAVVTGEIKVKARKARIAEMIAQGGIVLTVDALGEGVDVQGFGGAGFIDARSSLIKIVQNVSRALRNGDDPSKVAAIIVPIVVKPGQTAELTGTLARVLEALREHDDRMEQVLTAAVRAQHGGERLTDAQEKQIAEWGLSEVLDGPFAESVLRGVAGEHDWRFERGYAHLLAHVAQTGSANMLANLVSEDRFPLGRWVCTQRETATGERRARLRALTGWLDDPRDVGWRAQLDAWRAFVLREARPPRSRLGLPDERELGTWAANTRAAYRAGKLSAARIADVEALPQWQWTPSTTPKTDQGHEAAKARRSAMAHIGPSGAVARINSGRRRWLSRLPLPLAELRSEGCAQSVIRRLIADGLATRHGGQRSGVLHATPAGRACLADVQEQAAK